MRPVDRIEAGGLIRCGGVGQIGFDGLLVGHDGGIVVAEADVDVTGHVDRIPRRGYEVAQCVGRGSACAK